jgi:hypothetical protein
MGQEGLFEVARMGNSPNRFRAVCAGFIADHDLHFVDLGALFRYMKRWNASLQSGELELLKSTFWGRPSQIRAGEVKKGASAKGNPFSDGDPVRDACGSVTNRGSRNFQRADASKRLPRGFGETWRFVGSFSRLSHRGRLSCKGAALFMYRKTEAGIILSVSGHGPGHNRKLISLRGFISADFEL